MLLTRLATILALMQTPSPGPDSLLTIAEASGYTQTSTSAQVLDLIERIRARSPIIRVGELGRTSQGKAIPLIVLANPPIDANELASLRRRDQKRGRVVCFVMANIHAGEVEGKEACLMLARELALSPPSANPLLQ